MMSTPIILSALSTLALCVSVLVAAYNVRQQLLLNRQGRVVDTFNHCLAAFDDLVRERAALETCADKGDASKLRARQYYGRYWDLMVREFELARAGLVPEELFERWYLAAHVELVRPESEAKLCDVSAREGWFEVGRSRTRVTSEVFGTLVERTMDQPEESAVLATLRSILKTAKGGGVFSALT